MTIFAARKAKKLLKIIMARIPQCSAKRWERRETDPGNLRISAGLISMFTIWAASASRAACAAFPAFCCSLGTGEGSAGFTVAQPQVLGCRALTQLRSCGRKDLPRANPTSALTWRWNLVRAGRPPEPGAADERVDARQWNIIYKISNTQDIIQL